MLELFVIVGIHARQAQRSRQKSRRFGVRSCRSVSAPRTIAAILRIAWPCERELSNTIEGAAVAEMSPECAFDVEGRRAAPPCCPPPPRPCHSPASLASPPLPPPPPSHIPPPPGLHPLETKRNRNPCVPPVLPAPPTTPAIPAHSSFSWACPRSPGITNSSRTLISCDATSANAHTYPTGRVIKRTRRRSRTPCHTRSRHWPFLPPSFQSLCARCSDDPTPLPAPTRGRMDPLTSPPFYPTPCRSMVSPRSSQICTPHCDRSAVRSLVPLICGGGRTPRRHVSPPPAPPRRPPPLCAQPIPI